MTYIYVDRNDLQSALDEFAACVRRYNCAPWKKELSRHFVVREDEISLSRLYHLSGKVHGKLNTTYDLLSALWECGCIRQARKILEVRYCFSFFILTHVLNMASRFFAH